MKLWYLAAAATNSFNHLHIQLADTSNKKGISFLQWALPRIGYRWDGFRKPRSQVLRRITERMQELELYGGFEAYRKYLENHPEEWEELDQLLDVTISKFFRDRKLWEYLRDEILAELLQKNDQKPAQIWSAGCCNGEEPYSIAIAIEQLREKSTIHREWEILATDRNREVLNRARAGRYPEGALKELTEEEIEKFFDPVDSGEDDYRIDPSLANRILFEYRDIRKSLPDRVFDLICCRNLVFTYYDTSNRQLFIERIAPHLCDGGYLVIGANENLPAVDWLKKTTSTHPVYQKRM